MQLQFRFPIDSLIIVVEILPQDTEDAFYIVDLADVLLKHQKWVSLLPRVEPFYGWYLGKICVVFAVDWQYQRGWAPNLLQTADMLIWWPVYLRTWKPSSFPLLTAC